MSNNTGNVLIALLAGAAVGAGIGILFAPDKGSRTREKIKHGYDDAKDNLVHKWDDVSREIKKRFSNRKNDLEKTYEDLVANMSDKNGDVISFLETKLADLKEQNAKLQN